MARKKKGFPRLAVGIVEVIGLGLAVFLMLISMGVIYKEELPCPRGGIFACHSVLRGKYSHMGPVPIAHMGVLYFVVQIALTYFLGRIRSVAVLKGLMTLGGLAFVGYLRSIEILWLRAMCPWCLAVALTVLVEGVLLYPLYAPPLVKVGWFGRIAQVLLFFFAMIGITCLGGQFIRLPKTLPSKPQNPTPLPTVKPTTKPESKTSPKPDATYTPTPRKSPRPRAEKTPAPKPVVTPANGSAENSPELLPYPDTTEGLVFRDRHWRLAATDEALTQIVDAEAPVLLLVYDPYCPVCEQLITKVLSEERMDLVPVAKVAIDQAELTGDLSPEVKFVPTLMVVGPANQVLFKHEGMIELDDLIGKIEQAITGNLQ